MTPRDECLRGRFGATIHTQRTGLGTRRRHPRLPHRLSRRRQLIRPERGSEYRFEALGGTLAGRLGLGLQVFASESPADARQTLTSS
jgi:hypothetical protein